MTAREKSAARTKLLGAVDSRLREGCPYPEGGVLEALWLAGYDRYAVKAVAP